MAPGLGWTLTADSPLLPFVDVDRGKARFTVPTVHHEPLPAVTGLLAGAADVDITPPPGLPKAGYSRNAHTGDGFRTRLRARVLHLRAGTTSMAIVQCDLLGGSSLVHHLVARAVADRTDVPIAGLMMGATHTHAGPGNFLGSDQYNRFASNKPGLDAAWTQFLTERIAGGVEEAVSTRRPARLAFGRMEVWGLTRNRSLAPHVCNETVSDRRTEAQRKFVAINPWLQLLRVDAAAADGGFDPLAAMVIFSVHGTGVSMRAHEYNADLWAYLCGELANRIEQATGHRPVVGAIEGTHADCAPAIRPGLAGHLESARVGRGIGARGAELHAGLEAHLTDEVVLGAGLRQVDLDRDRSIDGIELPRRPAIGASLIAGAHENETPVVRHIPPFRPGMPKRFGRTTDQGPKWVVGSRWLQPLIIPTSTFPRVLPVQVLRIGDVALVGLPFEVTVESGRRIERAVDEAVSGSGVARTIVTSVANEYVGYVTTPEEYERQHYEGGHTVYGSRTLAFLCAHAARVARETTSSGAVDDVIAEREFALHVRRYLPRPSGSTIARSFNGAATFTDPTATEDGYWAVEWRDAPPGDLDWHEPLVRVEAVDGDGFTADDSGWDIGVTHLGGEGDAHRYRTRWYDPVRAGRQHRFVLPANRAQPEVASEGFD